MIPKLPTTCTPQCECGQPILLCKAAPRPALYVSMYGLHTDADMTFFCILCQREQFLENIACLNSCNCSMCWQCVSMHAARFWQHKMQGLQVTAPTKDGKDASITRVSRDCSTVMLNDCMYAGGELVSGDPVWYVNKDGLLEPATLTKTDHMDQSCEIEFEGEPGHFRQTEASRLRPRHQTSEPEQAVCRCPCLDARQS